MEGRTGLKRRFPERHVAIRMTSSLSIPNMDGSCSGTQAGRKMPARFLRALTVGASGLLVPSPLSPARREPSMRSDSFLKKQDSYLLVTLRNHKNQESCCHPPTTLPYCQPLMEVGPGNDALCRRRFSPARS